MSSRVTLTLCGSSPYGWQAGLGKVGQIKLKLVIVSGTWLLYL